MIFMIFRGNFFLEGVLSFIIRKRVKSYNINNAKLSLEDKQQFKFGGVMSDQYTHSYIAFSILNCCNLLKFYVF